jgi:hypothetical protein
MIRLAHIVNPVLVDRSSDLFVAQPITFEAMRVARSFAAGQVAVELLSAQYPEDHPVVPADFRRTPDLEKSVLDYGKFDKPRKLPLLKDILDRLHQGSDAEYLIYTNVDIGLLPHFYLTVKCLVAAGYDAFTINRRTISDRYTRPDQIPLMYAELGRPHRGWDCFVFRRDVYPKYQLGSICLGAPRVGLALIANLWAHADSFREFSDEHLTFHLGNDRSWGQSRHSAYAAHNTRQAYQIIETLEQKVGPFGRNTPPGKFMFFQRSRLLKAIYDFYVRFHIPLHLVRAFQRTGGRSGAES